MHCGGMHTVAVESLLETEASQDVFEMTASVHDVATRDLRALWCGQSSRASGPESEAELIQRSPHFLDRGLEALRQK